MAVVARVASFLVLVVTKVADTEARITMVTKRGGATYLASSSLISTSCMGSLYLQGGGCVVHVDPHNQERDL